MTGPRYILLALSVALGCDVAAPQVTGSGPGGTGGGGVVAPERTGGTGGTTEPAPVPDAGFALGEAGQPAVDTGPAAPGLTVVYAHSGSDLFRVDPETFNISRVGPFAIDPNGAKPRFLNNVTDIAVDKNGKIIGITFQQLLAIDPSTAECRIIANLPSGSSYNGLSFIRTADGGEILAATAGGGTVTRVDPVTGMATMLGDLGMGQASSGDLVSVASYGTLITLKGAPLQADVLARVDPATGAATPIGSTGFRQVYGIGFWGNRVFGFTSLGEFILIDPKSGAGTLVRREPAYPFFGAGVSTSAPVIVD